MSEAVETRPVAEAVIRELNLGLSPEDFLKNLSVKQVANTQFIGSPTEMLAQQSRRSSTLATCSPSRSPGGQP
jgi:capsular polysaccharide biosynthesis protein